MPCPWRGRVDRRSNHGSPEFGLPGSVSLSQSVLRTLGRPLVRLRHTRYRTLPAAYLRCVHPRHRPRLSSDRYPRADSGAQPEIGPRAKARHAHGVPPDLASLSDVLGGFQHGRRGPARKLILTGFDSSSLITSQPRDRLVVPHEELGILLEDV